MQAFGVYQKYRHYDVLRAIVIREQDAKILAEKWQCNVKPIKFTIEETK